MRITRLLSPVHSCPCSSYTSTANPRTARAVYTITVVAPNPGGATATALGMYNMHYLAPQPLPVFYRITSSDDPSLNFITEEAAKLWLYIDEAIARERSRQAQVGAEGADGSAAALGADAGGLASSSSSSASAAGDAASAIAGGAASGLGGDGMADAAAAAAAAAASGGAVGADYFGAFPDQAALAAAAQYSAMYGHHQLGHAAAMQQMALYGYGGPAGAAAATGMVDPSAYAAGGAVDGASSYYGAGASASDIPGLAAYAAVPGAGGMAGSAGGDGVDDGMSTHV